MAESQQLDGERNREMQGESQMQSGAQIQPFNKAASQSQEGAAQAAEQKQSQIKQNDGNQTNRSQAGGQGQSNHPFSDSIQARAQKLADEAAAAQKRAEEASRNAAAKAQEALQACQAAAEPEVLWEEAVKVAATRAADQAAQLIASQSAAHQSGDQIPQKSNHRNVQEPLDKPKELHGNQQPAGLTAKYLAEWQAAQMRQPLALAMPITPEVMQVASLEQTIGSASALNPQVAAPQAVAQVQPSIADYMAAAQVQLQNPEAVAAMQSALLQHQAAVSMPDPYELAAHEAAAAAAAQSIQEQHIAPQMHSSQIPSPAPPQLQPQGPSPMQEG